MAARRPAARSASAWGGSPDSLNPGNGVLTEAYTLYELVYDTPISVTSAGEYVPELATDWEPSEDGLTWTMNIVEGATFHDGEPLTAEDVAFSVELYRDTPDFPFLPSYAAPFETVEVVSDTQLTLTTAEPLVTFESYMAFIYVLPKHIWEGVEDAVEFENEEMIGSGPFALTAYEQGVSVELASNADYWQTPANIDGVIFQTIENPDGRVTALTTGDVDAITEFPATTAGALQNAENVYVHIADIAAGGSLPRRVLQHRGGRGLPGRRRRLLRPSGAQGHRRATRAGDGHGQAEHHRCGHARDELARSLGRPARPRRVLRQRGRGLRVRRGRGERDARRGGLRR